MTEEQQIVLMLKGMLSEAPEDVREKINEAADKLRAILKEYGDEGGFAIGLVGAEYGASDGK